MHDITKDSATDVINTHQCECGMVADGISLAYHYDYDRCGYSLSDAHPVTVVVTEDGHTLSILAGHDAEIDPRDAAEIVACRA